MGGKTHYPINNNYPYRDNGWFERLIIASFSPSRLFIATSINHAPLKRFCSIERLLPGEEFTCLPSGSLMQLRCSAAPLPSSNYIWVSTADFSRDWHLALHKKLDISASTMAIETLHTSPTFLHKGTEGAGVSGIILS